MKTGTYYLSDAVAVARLSQLRRRSTCEAAGAQVFGDSTADADDPKGAWCRRLHAYEVGKIALHSGQVVHQISSAMYLTPEDARVTLQGHAVFSNGVWEVYW